MLAKEIIKENIQIIKNYHEETKHYPYKSANALGYMDWKGYRKKSEFYKVQGSIYWIKLP